MEAKIAPRFGYNELYARLGITSKELEAIGLQQSVLQDIYEHHIGASADLQSVANYILQRLQQVPSVHSLRVRIKDPEHLVAKIIRKKRDDPDRNFDLQTYQAEVTDLIGLRAIHLFKAEWSEIHEFVCNTWDIHGTPIANVREGDPPVLLNDFKAAGCEVKVHDKGYRSIHYILKSQPEKRAYLAELQVRTIFEEGWSEIDHRVRYPRHSDNVLLAEILGVLNRLSGSADEMGTFINELRHFVSEQEREISERQRQIEQQASAAQETILKLEGAQGKADDFKKQIEELKKQIEEQKKSSQSYVNLGTLFNPTGSALNISNPTHSPGILNYETAVVPNWPQIQARTCTKCGKSFCGSNSVLDILPPTCSDCRSKELGIHWSSAGSTG